jgi:hypothetical protein
MPPPFNGSGASRVHNTTDVGDGSPLATPSVNGSPGRSAAGGSSAVGGSGVDGSVVVDSAAVVLDAGLDDGLGGVLDAGAVVGDDAEDDPPSPEHAARAAPTGTVAEIARNVRREIGRIGPALHSMGWSTWSAPDDRGYHPSLMRSGVTSRSSVVEVIGRG